MIRKILRTVLPASTVRKLYVRFPNKRARSVGTLYAREIEKLDIEDAGITEDNFAYIKIRNGFTFHSFNVMDGYEVITHRFLSEQKKKQIPVSCIRCAKDIAVRFYWPHILANATPEHLEWDEKKYFHPNHFDSINDFDLSDDVKKDLIDRFQAKEGDVVLDIGAHSGVGAMALSQMVGPTGKVVCFEADEPSFQLLKKNIESNNITNVEVHHVAVWNERKTMRFKKQEYEQNSLVHEVIEQNNQMVEVQADCIDNLVKEYNLPKVDFMSYTINGAEPEGLQGAVETIKSNPGIRINIAGWYIREGKSIAEHCIPTLKEAGMHYAVGPYRKLIAWTDKV